MKPFKISKRFHSSSSASNEFNSYFLLYLQLKLSEIEKSTDLSIRDHLCMKICEKYAQSTSSDEISFYQQFFEDILDLNLLHPLKLCRYLMNNLIKTPVPLSCLHTLKYSLYPRCLSMMKDSSDLRADIILGLIPLEKFFQRVLSQNKQLLHSSAPIIITTTTTKKINNDDVSFGGSYSSINRYLNNDNDFDDEKQQILLGFKFDLEFIRSLNDFLFLLIRPSSLSVINTKIIPSNSGEGDVLKVVESPKNRLEDGQKGGFVFLSIIKLNALLLKIFQQQELAYIIKKSTDEDFTFLFREFYLHFSKRIEGFQQLLQPICKVFFSYLYFSDYFEGR